MNSWRLPTSLRIGEVDWQIETDYRTIIDVLEAFKNPEYDEEDRAYYCLISVIKDFDNLPEGLYGEALKKIYEFIDMGERSEKHAPQTMDWEQDANMIIPAINRVVGKEIRLEPYMHWWTFMSAYLEIGECTFSSVAHLRHKMATGKKLEKWEREYIQANKDVVYIHKKKTEEEIREEEAERKALDDLLG